MASLTPVRDSIAWVVVPPAMFFCLHANLRYFQLHDNSGIKREEDQNIELLMKSVSSLSPQIKLDWLVHLLANRTIPGLDSIQSCNSKPHVKSARVKLAPLDEASALGHIKLDLNA